MAANLKLVEFSANTFFDWIGLTNDIINYLNGQVFTSSLTDTSTANIATANAVNAIHSRVVSANSLANTVYNLSNNTYNLAQTVYGTTNTNYSYAVSLYGTANTLVNTTQELADFANSYNGFVLSSSTQRYQVVPWIDSNGVINIGKTINFHSSNVSASPNANIVYNNTNNAFEFSGSLVVGDKLSVLNGANTVLHINDGSNDIIKIEANGHMTGLAVEGPQTKWLSARDFSNTNTQTYTTANGVPITVFDFSETFFSNNSVTFSLPKSWDGGNVFIRIYGITNSTTGNSAHVVLKSHIVGDDESIFYLPNSGAELLCNSSANGANTLVLSGSDYTELNLENKAALNANNDALVHLFMYREKDSAQDTLEVPFRMVGAKIKYGTRQLTDI